MCRAHACIILVEKRKQKQKSEDVPQPYPCFNIIVGIFLFFSVISQVFCVKFSVFYSFCQAVCDINKKSGGKNEHIVNTTLYSAQNADILWYIITY